MSVDLPEPDAPVTENIIPGADCQVDVPQCTDTAFMIYFTRMDEL